MKNNNDIIVKELPVLEDTSHKYELEEAINFYKQFGLDDSISNMFLESIESIRHKNLILIQAKKQGEAVGLNIGKRQEKIEIAKNMLLDNEPTDKIMKYTNLSITDIEKIKSEL